MKIAILGANGRVANEVAKAYLNAGHDVIAITRDGKARGLSGQVEFRAADALKPGALAAATAGADLIFNGLNPLYHEWEEKAVPMAREVVAAMRANRIPQLFIGNVYNFGRTIHEGMREDDAFSADVRKGALRNEMEGLFRTAAETEGLKTIILRAGDFFGGSGTGSWFDLAIADKVDKGTFTWPGPMGRVHAFAYLPDLARAFVTLGEAIDTLPAFDTYHFEGHAVTGATFKAAMERATGRSLKTAGFPWWLIRIAGTVKPIMRELARMSYLWDVAHSLDGTKFRDRFGAPVTTPLDAAIAESLAALGKMPTPRAKAA